MAHPTSTWHTPGRRRQSEAKRAAMLDAAEELFASSGYELTSVDAIAARASVSKRTVYDHFGGKRALFWSVVGRVDEALFETMRTVIRQELTDGRELREALLAFVRRLTTDVISSSIYATFRRLNAQAASVPGPSDRSSEEPEALLEERFAQLAAAGELKVSDPRRAVQHFFALTMLLVIDAVGRDPESTVDGSETQAIIADGVDAFLRAYR